MIRVDALNASWEGRGAIKDISFEVGAGQCLAIVGPSGCGKTTILRTLIGELEPDSGTISFVPPTSASDRLVIGYLPQFDDLFPWLSVEANVAKYASLANPDRDLDRSSIDRILIDTGLHADRKRHVFELSGGMRRRLGIARILAAAPPYWIFDEPFSALDVQSRRLLRHWLHGQLVEKDATVIFVTHDREDIEELADLVLELDGPPARMRKAVEARTPNLRPGQQ